MDAFFERFWIAVPFDQYTVFPIVSRDYCSQQVCRRGVERLLARYVHAPIEEAEIKFRRETPSDRCVAEAKNAAPGDAYRGPEECYGCEGLKQ